MNIVFTEILNIKGAVHMIFLIHDFYPATKIFKSYMWLLAKLIHFFRLVNSNAIVFNDTSNKVAALKKTYGYFFISFFWQQAMPNRIFYQGLYHKGWNIDISIIMATRCFNFIAK